MQKQKFQWTWQSKIAIVGSAFGLYVILSVIPAIKQARQAAHRSADHSVLFESSYGTFLFHQFNGTLPREVSVNAKSILSWQTQVLPCIERSDLFDKIHHDLTWDKKANKSVFSTPITSCVSHSLSARSGKNASGYALTTVSANRLLMNETMSLSQDDVTDGVSQTLLLGEIRENLPPWGKPGNFRDFTLEINRSPYGLGGHYPGGILVATVDSHTRFLSENIDPRVLEALATPDGGNDPGEF